MPKKTTSPAEEVLPHGDRLSRLRERAGGAVVEFSSLKKEVEKKLGELGERSADVEKLLVETKQIVKDLSRVNSKGDEGAISIRVSLFEKNVLSLREALEKLKKPRKSKKTSAPASESDAVPIAADDTAPALEVDDGDVLGSEPAAGLVSSVEADRLETERKEKERVESERLAAEADAERKRVEAEATAKAEAEHLETERKEKERVESERLAAEAETERKRVEAEAAAKAEADRLEAEAAKKKTEEPETKSEKKEKHEHGIVDITDSDILVILGARNITKMASELVRNPKYAEESFKRLFSVVTEDNRVLLETVLHHSGYTVEQFLKLWEGGLYKKVHSLLESYVSTQRRDIAIGSIGFIDKLKTDALGRMKQTAILLTGVAATAGIGALVASVAAPAAGMLAAGAATGASAGIFGRFYQRTVGKFFGKSQEDIQKNRAAQLDSRLLENQVTEKLSDYFADTSRAGDIAVFISQGLRNGTAHHEDQANAELMRVEVLRRIAALYGMNHGEFTALMAKDDDKELSVREREIRAQGAQAQVLIESLGHMNKNPKWDEEYQKNAWWVDGVEKIFAARRGDLGKPEESTKEVPAPAEAKGAHDAHGAHGSHDAHAAPHTEGKKEKGKSSKKDEKKKKSADAWQSYAVAGIAGSAIGAAVSSTPYGRGVMGGLTGGYLGYRYGKYAERRDQEKAMMADVTKAIARVQELILEGTLNTPDGIEEAQKLAMDIRMPMSFGLIDPKKQVSLYVRAHNTLRNIDRAMVPEILKEDSAQKVVEGLASLNDDLHTRRSEEMANGKGGWGNRRTVYAIGGAIIGVTLGYAGQDIAKAGWKAGHRLFAGETVSPDTAPDVPPVERPIPGGTISRGAPEVFLVHKGQGLSHAILADLHAHRDHVSAFASAHADSPEGKIISRLLTRHGGDVNALTEKDLDYVAGQMSKHDFNALDAQGNTIVGVKGADKLGLYFDKSQGKFVISNGAGEMYKADIPLHPEPTVEVAHDAVPGTGGHTGAEMMGPPTPGAAGAANASASSESLPLGFTAAKTADGNEFIFSPEGKGNVPKLENFRIPEGQKMRADEIIDRLFGDKKISKEFARMIPLQKSILRDLAVEDKAYQDFMSHGDRIHAAAVKEDILAKIMKLEKMKGVNKMPEEVLSPEFVKRYGLTPAEDLTENFSAAQREWKQINEMIESNYSGARESQMKDLEKIIEYRDQLFGKKSHTEAFFKTLLAEGGVKTDHIADKKVQEFIANFRDTVINSREEFFDAVKSGESPASIRRILEGNMRDVQYNGYEYYLPDEDNIGKFEKAFPFDEFEKFERQNLLGAAKENGFSAILKDLKQDQTKEMIDSLSLRGGPPATSS